MSEVKEELPLFAPIEAEVLDYMGGTTRVTNVARVSHDKWVSPEPITPTPKDERLFSFLADAEPQHWSPFAHVIVQMRCRAPIFVARQWFKSTVGVVRNEESRRYIDGDVQFWVPQLFHKRPAENIKQGSGELFDVDAQATLLDIAVNEAGRLRRLYNDLIDVGMAPEEARMFLPQNTLVTWIETGSLWYVKRVLELRSHSSGAQKSGTVELADKVFVALAQEGGIGDAIKRLCPDRERFIK